MILNFFLDKCISNILHTENLITIKNHLAMLLAKINQNLLKFKFNYILPSKYS